MVGKRARFVATTFVPYRVRDTNTMELVGREYATFEGALKKAVAMNNGLRKAGA